MYLDAEWLRHSFDPDFLLVHPMGIDDAGHRAGLNSSTYRNTARYSDMALSDHLPTWIQEGYQIMITADHGMNNDNSHGGILQEEVEVPFYVIGDAFSHDSDCEPQQVDICGIACELLGLAEHGKLVTDGLFSMKDSWENHHHGSVEIVSTMP